MAVPYTFQTATGSIPLSQLDSNFATGITIGNTSVLLGDSISTINNLSLANVAITSVSTSFPNGYLANSNVIVGTTTLTLGSTVTTIDGLTLGNVTIASGNVTISNVSVSNFSATTANVSGTANISNLVVIGNATVGGNVTAAKGTFTSANVSGTANISTLVVTGNASFTSTGAVLLAKGTTAQQPTGVAGLLRFNTDSSTFEGYNGTAWAAVGGGATGGGTDQIFVQNQQTVTTNYTITTNYNAMSTGPITINSGITVTVPSGSNWVVL